MNRHLLTTALLSTGLAFDALADQHAPAVPAQDPLAHSSGSWGQYYPDQWGLDASGLSTAQRALLAEQGLEPAIVAIIDTGVDYSHPELPETVFWRNPKEAFDGQDNDGNGLIDDVIGWNFVANNNRPWDDHGHGTHLAGVIAASSGNGLGMAGIAPNSQLMILKALAGDGFGNGSQVAAAIRYAVDQGAQIIQLSLGGAVPGDAEEAAIRYAATNQRLVVVAAGNGAKQINDQGYEAIPGVLLVGAATPEGERARFSDWGNQLALLAPGVDVLSLRARGTDFLQRSGNPDYKPGSAVVNQQYYRASGNSFAAPWVTGAAALIWGLQPELSRSQVVRMLTQSATDAGPDGFDMNYGYGLLNVAAAITTTPDYFVDSRISHARWQPDTGLQLFGHADASRFREAKLAWGRGDEPEKWQVLKSFLQPVRGSELATLDPTLFPAGARVTIRLTAQHADGTERVSYYQLQMPTAPAPTTVLPATGEEGES